MVREVYNLGALMPCKRLQSSVSPTLAVNKVKTLPMRGIQKENMACMVETRNAYKILVLNLKGRCNFGDLRVDRISN